MSKKAVVFIHSSLMTDPEVVIFSPDSDGIWRTTHPQWKATTFRETPPKEVIWA